MFEPDVLAPQRRATMNSWCALPLRPIGALIVSCMALAGCAGGEVTVDLAADAPADTTSLAVSVRLEGLEFRRTDGSTEPVRFSTPEPVNLLDHTEGQIPLRVLTDEQLPDGTYSGVRLLFDDSDPDAMFVREVDGAEIPLLLETGDFVAIDISVQDDESSQSSLTLTLDLRQSLSLDVAADEYTLRPLLRSVATSDAAQVFGSIAVACPTGSSLQQGGAVYLFAGQNQEPDDRDGVGVEPYATTNAIAGFDGTFSYQLRALPAGSYTIAATCNGDEENPKENDTLDFAGRSNIRLREGEALELDIT